MLAKLVILVHGMGQQTAHGLRRRPPGKSDSSLCGRPPGHVAYQHANHIVLTGARGRASAARVARASLDCRLLGLTPGLAKLAGGALMADGAHF